MSVLAVQRKRVGWRAAASPGIGQFAGESIDRDGLAPGRGGQKRAEQERLREGDALELREASAMRLDGGSVIAKRAHAQRRARRARAWSCSSSRARTSGSCPARARSTWR
ncbi:MAG: hypothetical protein ACKOUS_01405, partial [Alphaproteobacteria bacterium]